MLFTGSALFGADLCTFVALHHNLPHTSNGGGRLWKNQHMYHALILWNSPVGLAQSYKNCLILSHGAFPPKPDLFAFPFPLCLKWLLLSSINPFLLPPSRRCYNTVQSETNPFIHPSMVSLLCPHVSFFFFPIFSFYPSLCHMSLE